MTASVSLWHAQWTDSMLEYDDVYVLNGHDAYRPNGLPAAVGNRILILVLGTERYVRRTVRRIAFFAVKIVKLPDQTNELAIGHTRKSIQLPERRVVQKASSKSPRHPSLRGHATHV
jgi:hypothetical protein